MWQVSPLTVKGDGESYIEGNTPGSAATDAQGIGADTTGALYVTGTTACATGFATPGAHQLLRNGSTDIYLLKLDSSGRRSWSTYFGGPSTDGNTISHTCGLVGVSRLGHVFVAAETQSSTGIATSNEYQTTYGGSGDCALASFDSTGNFDWATYYGGTSEDIPISLTVDYSGNPVLAGMTSSSTGFATTGAHQTSGAGGWDGFVVRFCHSANVTTTSSSTAYCQGQSTTLGTVELYDTYQWQQNGVAIAGATASTYTIPTTLAVGTYRFSVAVSNPLICPTTSPDIIVRVFAHPSVSAGPNQPICQGTGVVIGSPASGGTPPYSYHWVPSTGLSSTNAMQPIASPTVNTTYYVTATDSNGCQATDSTTLTINPSPTVVAGPSGPSVKVCLGTPVKLGHPATLGTPPYSYVWSPSAGLISTTTVTTTASPTQTTIYTVIVTDANGCRGIDSVQINIDPPPVMPLLPNELVCPGYPTKIGATATGATPPYTYAWQPTTGLDNSSIAIPTATPAQPTDYLVTVTDANGCQTIRNQFVGVDITPTPFLNRDRTEVYCPGDSIILSVPSIYTSYKWSTGETTSSIKAGPGQHSVVVTNQHGCVGSSESVTIFLVPAPAPVIDGPLSTCPNSRAHYTSLDTAISGFLWTLSGGGVIIGRIDTNAIVIDWQTAGSYQLELRETMASGGCIRDTTFTITVDKDLHPTITTFGPTTICTGDTVVLTAASGYDTYRWSDGRTTPAIKVATTGDYSVTVANSAGCTGSSLAVHIEVTPDTLPSPYSRLHAHCFVLAIAFSSQRQRAIKITCGQQEQHRRGSGLQNQATTMLP